MTASTASRQIVLDTETTGISPATPAHQGHRVIEIGAVELINRKRTTLQFHTYLQPDRSVDPNAIKIHGIRDSFLKDQPRFAAVSEAFLTFIKGAELIIHNAAFDIGFLNQEFLIVTPADTAPRRIADHCTILDTLSLAREQFPGKKNSLDALCQRFGISRSHRTYHGALLDAELLAEVYLALTGGQTLLDFHTEILPANQEETSSLTKKTLSTYSARKIITADTDALIDHKAWIERCSQIPW